jgi:hypothetical protein
MKKTFIMLIFVVCFLSVSFIVMASDIETLDVVKFGIFKAELVSKEEAAGAAAGMKNIVKNVVLVEQTTNIPAHTGTRFGFEFIIKGHDAGDKVDLTYKYFHPRMTNPQTGNLFISQEIKSKNQEIGKTASISYTFDHPWEEVPGEWILQVFYNDKKLAEKSFYIYKP